MSMSNDSTPAEVLRERMISQLRKMGAVRSDRIADAFRTVDRVWFTPEASPEHAYNPRAAVPGKWDGNGVPISTVTSPQLQAGMLEQADIHPGMRVLEIGSGGVNAAMLSHLVGPAGRVTTVDIDREVTQRARTLLDQAGYEQVHVLTADAEHGVAEHAPYDRIIVTVGAWDLPPAWREQLAETGRIVVPLRMRGLTQSVALDRERSHLVSRSSEVSGFVAMQGYGATEERLLPLRGSKAVVRFDDGWPGRQPPELDGVLDGPRAQVWSGVTLAGSESFDTLSLWLATQFPGFGRLAAESDQKATLANSEVLWLDPAVVDQRSVAYLTARRAEPGLSELGAYAFGPNATPLAEAMAEQIRIWHREQRHGPGPEIAVWPHDAPETEQASPADLVITKHHTHITLSWPPA